MSLISKKTHCFNCAKGELIDTTRDLVWIRKSCTNCDAETFLSHRGYKFYAANGDKREIGTIEGDE